MTAARNQLLFLTGWPGCGFSHFGQWLAGHCGFRHLEIDFSGAASGPGSELWSAHMPADAKGLAADLLKVHPRWVVTAEDPVSSVDSLESLEAAGFQLWFLQARTESSSRLSWLQEERQLDPSISPAIWNRQAAAIRASARKLRPFFRDRCVTTLNHPGQLMAGEEFAAQIGVRPIA